MEDWWLPCGGSLVEYFSLFGAIRSNALAERELGKNLLEV